MTYEYLCTECGHAWEAEQSISAAPLKTCPHCQKDAAKRQVSGGAGFILKGGGWYSDLYSSAPKKSSGEGDSKPADASAKVDASAKKDSTSSDGGSKGTGSGSSGSSTSGSSGSSGSSGTPTSGTPSGSKATGAASGA
jgi:putative FmdB family regulatory protein